MKNKEQLAAEHFKERLEQLRKDLISYDKDSEEFNLPYNCVEEFDIIESRLKDVIEDED